MSFNLLETFQQNQSRIISAVTSGASVPSFAKATPSPSPPPAATSVSARASSAVSKPVLASNAAAKAKSQPRPNAAMNGSNGVASSSSRVSTSIGSSNANDYAAAILGSSVALSSPATASTVQPTIITPSMKTGGAAIYSAPASSQKLANGAHPPTAPASSATPTTSAAAAALPHSTPTGPTTNIVKSQTNANVSLVKNATTAFDTSKCAECGPSAEVIIDPHQGIEVCTRCGLVVGAYISDESEWRTFSDRRGEDPNRVGGPEIGLLADAGLATLMGDSPNGLGSNLAKLQNKSALSQHHRVLLDAFRKSSRFAALLSLPDSITNRANELYKRIVESKLIRVRGDALIVTCLFIVCKLEHVPRTIKEMCSASEVQPKELSRCFKEVKKFGFHKTLITHRGGAQNGSIDEDDADEYKSYITRWGNQIRLAPKLIELAKVIADKSRDLLHTSRDPGSLCGAALYIASQCGAIEDRKMLTTISAVVSMSVNTIKSVVQSIIQNKTTIMPPEYLQFPIEI